MSRLPTSRVPQACSHGYSAGRLFHCDILQRSNQPSILCQGCSDCIRGRLSLHLDTGTHYHERCSKLRKYETLSHSLHPDLPHFLGASQPVISIFSYLVST